MRKNCSSDQEKLLKFEAEGQEFSKFLRSLKQFIQTVKGRVTNSSERSEHFLVTECFFNFLISNKLEQLEFKSGKIIGI